jgi:hypothetical protein
VAALYPRQGGRRAQTKLHSLTPQPLQLEWRESPLVDFNRQTDGRGLSATASRILSPVAISTTTRPSDGTHHRGECLARLSKRLARTIKTESAARIRQTCRMLRYRKPAGRSVIGSVGDVNR